MNGLAAIAHMGVLGLSQAATGSLVAAVWQGVLLAAVVGLALRLVPRIPAAARFAIWFGVFLVVTALPVISAWPHAASVRSVGVRGPWLTVDARWSLAIAAVWAVASLVRAGTLIAAALRVRALWKRATPVEIETNAGVYRSAQNDTSSFGSTGTSTRRAQICTSDEVDRPTVIGFFSPKILIPSWLLEKLTAAELEQIVLHEAGHLGRADDWMNLLQKIALVIFPLNPALAWVERRLCFERELAVDERVLQAFAGKAGAAKAYAVCLATLAEYRLGRRAMALALGALGRESELGRRVGRILRREAGMKPLHSKLVLGGAMLGLLVAAAGFERCPQVVGFAKDGSETVAHGQQRLPARGDLAAMDGAPGLNSARQFRAISVIYKASQNRQIPLIAHVIHQTVTLRPMARSEGSADSVVQRSTEQGVDGSARMVQTRAAVSLEPLQQPTLRDEATKNGPPRYVQAESQRTVQWVVVTEWQDGIGTRMVFTTARMSGAAVQETPTDPMAATSEQAVPSEQEPRYAAVPVRGGWLVFQL